MDAGKEEKHNIFVNRQGKHYNCFTLSLFPLTEKKMQIKQRPEVHDPHEI
jgi:hypothetical protein